MISMRKRVTLANITSTFVMEGTAPEGFPEGSASYLVTLTNDDGQTLTVPFHMGPMLCRDPETAEVLDCLISDASSIESSRSFEEWADDLGYDTDSRKAEETYRACEQTARDLRAFLGDDYEAFMYRTERM
jgi:hypothetical protein